RLFYSSGDAVNVFKRKYVEMVALDVKYPLDPSGLVSPPPELPILPPKVHQAPLPRSLILSRPLLLTIASRLLQQRLCARWPDLLLRPDEHRPGDPIPPRHIPRPNHLRRQAQTRPREDLAARGLWTERLEDTVRGEGLR